MIRFGPFLSLSLNILVDGAYITLKYPVDFFYVNAGMNVQLPNSLEGQALSMRYSLDDIRCEDYGSNFELGQVFSLLIIFMAMFTAVFVILVKSISAFLPAVWVSIWMAVIICSVATSAPWKPLCDRFCIGDPLHQIPEGTKITMPSGGLALCLISLVGCNVVVILSVLL
ncbi:hypothetical protein TraAM80_02659 [Trypanosoma rangeli]|uniref:Amastin n=1 Tax=Trypanosoma rangeli TaxID=5698 RepID=A0A422NT54_TRYRA|nr:uncharacterized protein TraAM80_02659 [Trypanosoma rangeli]RNF08633.1 hypothetical protein TraAM80_02659 [Trypanosoma rangeli]|eukprot:RNF08633.1 hypothetical protein TraAM80_02659 [Trypanosoma rangeli]